MKLIMPKKIEALYQQLQKLRLEACRQYDQFKCDGVNPADMAHLLRPIFEAHQKIIEDCGQTPTAEALYAIREYELQAEHAKKQAEYFMEKADDHASQAKKLKDAVMEKMRERGQEMIDCGEHTASIVVRTRHGRQSEDLIVR